MEGQFRNLALGGFLKNNQNVKEKGGNIKTLTN
jgi:hypothetical protein